MESFDIADPLEKLSRRWVWLVFAGLVGLAAGALFSFLSPPRYEAISAFTAGVNYGTIDFRELVIEDRILDRLWQLVRSDETLKGTLAHLNEDPGPSESWGSLDTLKEHIRLDTRLSRWELIGIDSDPNQAKEIADAWYQVALERLDEAYEHAWNAVSLPGASQG
jgi:hypothetical protein